MGTRADFYVGLGPDAEWLGSIAFDGYPDGVFSDHLIVDEESVFSGHGDETEWRDDVADFLAHLSHSTLPERGWPWPWDDSNTTDFAYTYDPETQRVLGSCFGDFWFLVAGIGDGELPEDDSLGLGKPFFPNMAERKNVRMDHGSGAIHIVQRPDGSMGVVG